MSVGAVTLQGQYYDGRHPIGSPATLILSNQEVALIGARVGQKYAMRNLRVSPRTGVADRFIALPDGGQVQCADHPLLDHLPREVQSEGLIAWLEQRWGVAVSCVFIIVAALIAGYFYGLPAAAERIAAHVPIETEQKLGGQTLVWLDSNQWFKPTQLDLKTQSHIRQGFAGLYQGLPLERNYRLEFRDSFVGANAFALPGGTIVITDDMVKAAKSTDEVLAVLAHEIGHAELRHTMRHILQDSAIAVVAATVTGDAASLSVAVAGLPAVLAQARYSREFETEADDYAFRLLKKRGVSPEAFATLMERLAEKHKDSERSYAFISTHPVTDDRVMRARAAAGK